MVPQVGQRIGPYEILGRLGSGGMGLVFSAWDARLQRDVAIKILREEYATPEMRSRFLQEARAASGLNHPNICTIFDIGEKDGDPYLVMELLKGETLRHRINAGGISLREILHIGIEIADALSAAHARGIIHRDIKPANIILVERPGGGYTTKVLDFGLAKIEAYGTESTFDLTHTGTTVGTVSYMSPEQARGEALDARSDLFSLGVMLYEMAAGRLPFQGATSALVFVELLSKPADPLRPQNPNIPEDLERIILKLLEKDRTLRYQSATQLLEDLDAVPFSGSGRTTWAPQPSTPPPSTRSRPIIQVPRHGAVRKDISGTSKPASTPPSPGPAPVEAPRATPSGDEVLRPVHRVAPSESSAVLRAASPPVPNDYDPLEESTGSFRPPSRPIVPQSARRGSDMSHPKISLPRLQSQRPQPRFSRIDEVSHPSEPLPVIKPLLPERRIEAAGELESKPRMWLLVVALVVMAGIGAVAWKFWPRHAGMYGDLVIPMMIAPVDNSTGDIVLTGAVQAGFEFGLVQSPQFLVEDMAAVSAGAHLAGVDPGALSSMDNARAAARAIGATEILVPSVHRNGGAYTVGFSVHSVDTGMEMLHTEETAQSREQIPDALDRLTINLRSNSGEDSDAIGRTALPLDKEASSNLEALNAYAAGENSAMRGRLADAAAALEHAVSLSVHFPQAYLRLADIYSMQHAQTAAADAAQMAVTSSQSSSDRTQRLAQASYALDATGDVASVGSILQPVLRVFPNSLRARLVAAQALHVAGKFPESLTQVQAALHRGPFGAATALAEMNLLALGRVEAARSLEHDAERAGYPHPDLRLLVDYLAAGEQGTIDTSADASGRIALGETQAALLDAVGQMHAGFSLWQAVASDAGAHAKLSSAASDALSQAALDHAMTGDCVTAESLATVAASGSMGPDAQFRTGLAAALCGNMDTAHSSLDALQSGYPHSFVVTSLYVPELSAAIQWKSGDTNGALDTLKSAAPFDGISFAPYLRGYIHLKADQATTAIADFQSMLQSPGATVLVSPVLYPMAQLGLARAWAASGDKSNSAREYTHFLMLWNNADPASPLLTEARGGAEAH